jgi:methionyl aminopeptidase
VYRVPGERKLLKGDLVKLDVTGQKDGFMADAAITVSVGVVSKERYHFRKGAGVKCQSI